MPPSPLPAPSPKRQALSTFLHGIEPRAWVFVLSQCGDESRAARAVQSALLDFVGRARSLPLAQWPQQFWTCLLRQPGLPAKVDSDSTLSQIAPGPRAALLLRLIVGLDFEQASQVLQVSPAAYEKALRNALAHPGMDDAKMQELREDLHAQIHQLSSERRQALEVMREKALSALAMETVPIAQPKRWFGRKRWWFVLALAVSLTTLVITLFQPVRSLLAPGQSEALPAEVIAPPPSLTDTVIVTHPDYQQLAQPEDEAIAGQLAFLSWIAATYVPASVVSTAAALTPSEAFADLSAAEQSLLSSAQTAWPTLDANTRAALLHQASHWQSLSPELRFSLRERLRQWDSQAAPDRARRRTPFVAWQRLSVSDQQRVHATTSYLAALPAPERQLLQEQFSALPADIQNLWWLGPALGEEMVPLASLFAYMPETERPALLTTVHALDAQSRTDLAMLAPRLSEARRQDLRRELLATPPEQRAELIRQRLAQ